MGEIFTRREHEEVPGFVKFNALGILAIERMWRIELYTRRND
jgi:hypothetical protein